MNKDINMKIFRIILLSIAIFSVLNCKRKSNKDVLLLADREAPMGWISLKMYSDKTFEFISSGFLSDDIYPGTYRIHNDTIYFEYSQMMPYAGKIAVTNRKCIKYIACAYPETLEIKLNKIPQHYSSH